jgi:sec-independent protein translocase protein TatA
LFLGGQQIMLGLSIPKLLLILAAALVLFGGKRLPQLGRSIGESIRGIKEGLAAEPVLIDDKKDEQRS